MFRSVLFPAEVIWNSCVFVFAQRRVKVEAEDEDTQVALALSKSLQPTAKPASHAVAAGARKKSKQARLDLASALIFSQCPPCLFFVFVAGLSC